ncbi:MAG: hypothetical protein ABFD13_06610 [Candidatus Cryosericum sp.]|nr:hypothetical protein [bacterium]
MNARVRLAVVLVILMGVVAGCAPKTPVTENPGTSIEISAMVKANAESPGYDVYDAVLLSWNVSQNRLASTSAPVLHLNDKDIGYGLHWSAGTPILAVQHWRREGTSTEATALLTVMSDDAQLLVPPEEIRNSHEAGGSVCRWYAPAERTFVAAPRELNAAPQKTLNGKTITVTEYPLTAGSTTQTLSVPIPSGLTQVIVVYGSGSLDSGFALAVAPSAVVTNDAGFDLWLLRMSGGQGTWVKCADTSGFDGNLVTDAGASFARIGSLLYFTYGHGKIYCIDTAAAVPSVTAPEKVNALLDQFYQQGPTDAEGPLQASLASEGDLLIIGYPDASWNELYYALDSSGKVLGHLRATEASVTSFDAQDRQGFSLAFKGMQWTVLFPSVDLFEGTL